MEAALARAARAALRRTDGRRLLLAVERPAHGRVAGSPTCEIGDWARPVEPQGRPRRSAARRRPRCGPATPAGFGQVGCVYTAQGFEYDWNGVLLGPDLVWRNGPLGRRPRRNRDPDFRNRKRVSDAEFDALVRNVYKVLLTRGLRGVYLYSTDAETQQLLAGLIS